MKRPADRPAAWALTAASGTLQRAFIDRLREQRTDQKQPPEETRFHAPDLTGPRWEEFLAGLRTFPAFSPWRLVIVARASALSKKSQEILAEFLKIGALVRTDLIILADGASATGGLESDLWQQCQHPALDVPGRSHEKWIYDLASQVGVTLSSAAATELIGRMGRSPDALAGCVEKLCLWVGQGGTIELKHVEAMVGRSLTTTVFEWSEAVVDGNAGTAVSRVRQILEDRQKKDRQTPIQLHGLLVWQFERIRRAQRLLAAGVDSQQLSVALKVPPYQLNRFMAMVRKISPERASRAVKQLARADLVLKSGTASPEQTLELLALELAG